MRSPGTSSRLTPLKPNRSSMRYVGGLVKDCSSTVPRASLHVLTELHALDRKVREVDLHADSEQTLVSPATPAHPSAVEPNYTGWSHMGGPRAPRSLRSNTARFQLASSAACMFW